MTDRGTATSQFRRPIRVRLLLAKFWGDDEAPAIVAAVDQTVWEHWEDSDEKAWRDAAERSWGLDPSDCEWREVWADFDPEALRRAFETPAVEGVIAESHTSSSARPHLLGTRESDQRCKGGPETPRLVALVRIFGRESCRDPRFVAWLVRKAGRGN